MIDEVKFITASGKYCCVICHHYSLATILSIEQKSPQCTTVICNNGPLGTPLYSWISYVSPICTRVTRGKHSSFSLVVFCLPGNANTGSTCKLWTWTDTCLCNWSLQDKLKTTHIVIHNINLNNLSLAYMQAPTMYLSTGYEYINKMAIGPWTILDIFSAYSLL